MAVVRQDIVQIEFQVKNANTLSEMAQQANNLRDTLAGVGKNGGMADMAKQAQSVKQSIGGVADGFTKAKVSAALLAGTVKTVGAGNTIKNLGNELKQVAGTHLKNGIARAKEFSSTIKTVGVGNTIKNLGKELKEVAGTHLKNGITKAKEFTSKLKQAANVDFSKLGSGLKSVGSTLARGTLGAATAGLTAITAGTAAAAAGVFKLTGMASDLTETQSKAGEVFGDSSAAVQNWAKTSIDSMGLAQQTALDMASLFGDMGTSMGLTRSEAAEMSMSLTQLGADLSSFKNMNIEEVTTALNGVFTGETESLKQLGIVMTQANLEQFAMEKGINKSISAMSEAEKLQLRYAYVMSKTANAQGDFARTGGGYANQLRMLKEQVKEIGTNIGKIFEPALTKGINTLNKFGKELNAIFSDGWQDSDLTKITDVFNRMLDTGIKALSDGLPKVIDFVVPALTQIMSSAAKALPTVADALLEGIVALLGGVLDILETSGPDMASALVQSLSDAVGSLAGMLPDALGTGLSVASSLVNSIAEELPSLMPTVANAVVGGLSTAFKNLPGLASAAVNLVNGLAEGVQKTLPTLVNSLPTLIQNLLTGLVKSLPSLISGAFNLVKTLIFDINWIGLGFQIITALVSGVWGAIVELLTPVVGWINTNVVQPVIQFFVGLGQSIGGVIQGVWDTIVTIWGAIVGWVSTTIIEPVTTFFSGLWTTITTGVQTAKDAITGAFQEAFDKVKEVWEKITGFFEGIWRKVKDTVGNILGGAQSFLGSVGRVFGIGYANGGLVTTAHRAVVGERGPEMIIPLSHDKRNRAASLWSQTGQILGLQPAAPVPYTLPQYTPESTVQTNITNRDESETVNISPSFTLNINGSNTDDRTMARKVKRWMREAVDDMAESMSRRNPRLQEI